MDDRPHTDLPYEDACHAMQTGVLYDKDSECNMVDMNRALKHLRVGINSTLVDSAALVRLLIKKGLFTREEYAEELRLEMCREVDRYEDKLAKGGQRVTLR